MGMLPGQGGAGGDGGGGAIVLGTSGANPQAVTSVTNLGTIDTLSRGPSGGAGVFLAITDGFSNSGTLNGNLFTDSTGVSTPDQFTIAGGSSGGGGASGGGIVPEPSSILMTSLGLLFVAGCGGTQFRYRSGR